MNALVHDVCGPASAPREWRRSLAKQRLALRSAIARSSLGGIGVRLGGSLIGEELIGTLSERLARSLQGLDESPSVNTVEPSTVRRAMEGAVNLPTTRRVDTGERAVASAGARRETSALDAVDKRVWNGAVTRDDRRRVGQATSVDADRLRELVDSVVGERGAQIVRAVGLDAPLAPREREVVRTSPLDAALRRYWHTSTRPANDASSQGKGPLVSRTEHRNAPVQVVSEARTGASATSIEPIATRADIVSPNEAAPSEPRTWWSTRVDAIHSRTESFAPAPARPTAARFDDDVIDESAFADALADVLHRQARAYGVIVP